MHNIISVGMSGYFNPKYKIRYNDRKNKYKKYLKIDIIKDSLHNVNKKNLNLEYKILIILIEKNIFILFYFLSIIRYIQKNI